ncbi:glycosyltransferase, partial [Streptomyces sp. McG5]|uniref:glycosyltransferase n=2 Tax=unclassified Streptomyces TaxID=2593676 RepID=UPI001BEC7685
MSGAVSSLVIAVPAHDEAASLPAALRSIRRALAFDGLPGVRETHLVVAADACEDATAAVAARHGARVVEVAHGKAGAARAAAVEHALRLCRAPAEETWIVTTDADCVVRPSWLARQLEAAGQGWDCVLGTIRIAPLPPVPAALRVRHDAHYFADRAGPGWVHPHVHGANLGVRADAYRAAGGFPPVACGEDRALVEALPGTARVLRTDACPVLTSGRTTPRAPGGFGVFLRDLAGHDGRMRGVGPVSDTHL